MVRSWERQAYDRDDEWPYFVKFRDAGVTGARSLYKIRVAGEITKPLHVLRDWCEEYYWLDRCAEYDKFLDGIRRREREALEAKTARDVSAEHMRLLQDMREVTYLEGAKLLRQAQENDFTTLKPAELIKLAEATVKMDRLVRGESTENTDVRVDYSALDKDELAAAIAAEQTLEALTKKLRGGK